MARHWGPRGHGRDQPHLLGEDLLVANTDLEYVMRQLGRESHRRRISVGRGTSRSPKLAVRFGVYLPSPRSVRIRTPKVGLADPFPGAYKNYLESCSLVLSRIKPLSSDLKDGDSCGTCLSELWFRGR